MTRQDALKLAGIAGLVFAIGALVAGFMIPEVPPTVKDPPEDFLAFVSDNRRLFLLSSAINILLIIPASVFVAGFWRVLRSTDSDDGVLALGATVAFVVAGAIATVCGGWFAGVGFLSDGHGLDAHNAKNLVLIGAILNQATFGPMAAAYGIGGYLLSKRGPFPSWVGYAGIVVAVIMAAGVFALREDNPLAPFSLLPLAGFVLFALYTALLSVLMIRTKA
ncbi:MAG TPA: DUF4386 family protein [Tepidiformaceae bacterium]|nr:DUF4386 family protein [Tepidiformaceae bacterium]